MTTALATVSVVMGPRFRGDDAAKFETRSERPRRRPAIKSKHQQPEPNRMRDRVGAPGRVEFFQDGRHVKFCGVHRYVEFFRDRLVGCAFAQQREDLELPGSERDRIPRRLFETIGRVLAARGLIVVSVDPKGPGKRAGVLIGDIVTAWDGEPLRRIRDVLDRLGPDAVGRPTKFSIVRAGQSTQATIEIGERPTS